MVQPAPSPRPSRKPRVLTVVTDPKPEEIGAPIDWSDWYLSWEDDVGQGPEQDDVVEVFSSSLEQLVEARQRRPIHTPTGANMRVGRDAFFAWIEQEPMVRVSPDVYLMVDPPEPPWPKMWETWRPGHHPPRFALEVVSEEWKKDYEEAPPKYALLGTDELVIHDPAAARGAAKSERVALQVYRRESDGAFVRVYVGTGPAWAETLGAWLVSRPAGGVGWLRLSDDRQGRALVPTAAERAEKEAQRAEKESQRAEKEAQRAEKESQRAEKEAQRAERESERAERESERAEKESERAEKESERAEKESERAERLADRLRELGVDPDDEG